MFSMSIEIDSFLLNSIYVCLLFLFLFNYCENECTSKIENKPDNTIIKPEGNIAKEIRYEDKYLDKYNNFPMNTVFTEEDLKKEKDKLAELIQEFNKNNKGEHNQRELEKEAHQYMFIDFFSYLKNSYVFENTPLGNVILFYNSEKGSFEYYSDKTMPYRYLETVARKYVTTFNCKILYTDMENEIKLAENKRKEGKENQERMEQNIKNTKSIQSINNIPKKDVFAQLKNYNKETPKNNMLPRPKNSIQVKTTSQLDDPLLKENANRYTHQGPITNFNMLKKITKKDIDKNYNLSYKDFKNRATI